MRRAATFALAGAGLVAAWARWRPFRVLVEGDSMEPTLADGDHVVAVRPRRIRRGDVVVVRPPGYAFEMVKRVGGVPGDEGLGPGEYLVLGDHAPRSTDGRVFGPVRRRDITGLVVARTYPRPGRLPGPRPAGAGG